MSFGFDAPEDVAGESNYLNDEGTFHFVVTEMKEGQSSKGSPIDGFTMAVDILAGTAEGCEGKSHDETVFSVDMSKSEGAQLAAKRRMAAIFIALDLMKPADLGKPVSIELQDAVGRQGVVRLVRGKTKDDNGNYTVPSKFLQIDYAAVFHIDDPEVKDIPKAADALEMIPGELRHDASYFAFKAKKGTGKPAPVATSKATPAMADALDDI